MPSSPSRLLWALLGVLLLGACARGPAAPACRDGALDLSGWDVAKGPVALDGDWAFRFGALVGPGEPLPAAEPFAVPGLWNGRRVAGQILGGDGHGTFRLRLRLPRPGTYGLLLRITAAAYRLWVDKELVAESGIVGASAAATTPASVTRAASFTTPRGEVTLTLQLASYHHARGGLRASVVVGTDQQIRAMRERQLVLYGFAVGCLAILMLYQLALFLLRPREPLPLYLASFAALIGVWITMHGPLLFTVLLPGLPYGALIHIEYLVLYASPCAAALFVRALFPQDTPRLLLRLTLAVFLAFELFVVLLPPRLFTRTLPPFAAASMGTALCYFLVVLRAAWRRRPESWLLLVGVLALCATVAFDAVLTLIAPTYVEALTPAGLLCLVLTEALVLSRRSARAHATVEEQAEKLRRQSEASHRFVPQAFLRLLGKEDITAVRLGDQAQREMAVLFADVRGFTALSERMTLAENFAFVNRLLGALGPVIREHGGFIDKYLGDGIMALFPRAPEDALRATVAIRRALVALNAERAGRGEPAVRVGIGVHAGTLMLGTVGEPERMDGTVIADAVNTAARLEGLTAQLGVSAVVSEPVVAALRDPSAYALRPLGSVRPKGKQAPVRIYEVIDGDPEALAAAKRASRPDFEAGIGAFEAGRFDEAQAGFAAARTACPEDRAAARYLERAAQLALSGAPAGWDGAEILTEK